MQHNTTHAWNSQPSCQRSLSLRLRQHNQQYQWRGGPSLGLNNDCSTDHGLWYNLWMNREGGGIQLAQPGGGWDDHRGPPFFSLRGGATGGKVALPTTSPPVAPTPPPLPVPPPVQLKFPRVINSDSPLNDSRQLEWILGSTSPPPKWTNTIVTVFRSFLLCNFF